MLVDRTSHLSSGDRPSDPIARRIDLLADEYERQRRQGEQPDLDSLLARVPQEAQDILRAELAVLEAELCWNTGQEILPDVIAAKFGIQAEPVHAWLKALQDGGSKEASTG